MPGRGQAERALDHPGAFTPPAWRDEIPPSPLRGARLARKRQPTRTTYVTMRRDEIPPSPLRDARLARKRQPTRTTYVTMRRGEIPPSPLREARLARKRPPTRTTYARGPMTPPGDVWLTAG